MSLDSGDMSWVLTSIALVQIMTPGLAFFYGGMVGENAVISTLMLSYGCQGVVTLLWALIGYSMSFGPSTPDGVVGTDALAVYNFQDEVRQIGWNADGTALMSTVSEHAYSMFQLMFAIVTPALISGAIVGKMKYQWFMAFTALWHLLVYCPLAHWLFYYDGWLFVYGAIDFAGGMVVHTSSGVSALVLTWWLGKPKHGQPHTHNPHNVPYILLGAALLWFGWFGFNAGSALGAGFVAGRALTNTQHAAAMAMLSWGAMEVVFNDDKWFGGRPTAVGAATGAVIGLIGITPACGYVSSMWALFIGFFTVVVCFFVPRYIKSRLGIDDRLDAFGCHGVGGIMGSLLTGLFASKELGDSPVDGGFFGDNGVLLGKQIVAILVTVALCIVMTSLIYWILHLTAKHVFKTDIRIPDEMQHEVDSSQHGERAYFRAVKTIAPNMASALPVATTAATPVVEAPSGAIATIMAINVAPAPSTSEAV